MPIKTEFPSELIDAVAHIRLLGVTIDLEVGPTPYLFEGRYVIATGVGRIYDNKDREVFVDDKNGSPLVYVVMSHNGAVVALSELRPVPQWMQRRVIALCIHAHLIPLSGRRGSYPLIDRRQLKRVV